MHLDPQDWINIQLPEPLLAGTVVTAEMWNSSWHQVILLINHAEDAIDYLRKVGIPEATLNEIAQHKEDAELAAIAADHSANDAENFAQNAQTHKGEASDYADEAYVSAQAAATSAEDAENAAEAAEASAYEASQYVSASSVESKRFEVIGDGVQTTFTFTHPENVYVPGECSIQVRTTSAPHYYIVVSWNISSAGKIIIEFPTAPSVNEYTVEITTYVLVTHVVTAAEFYGNHAALNTEDKTILGAINENTAAVSGVMHTNVYDTNNTGVVDNAEQLNGYTADSFLLSSIVLDYVVARGENADNMWVKYNSGWMIQTKRVRTTTAVSTAFGGIYIHGGTAIALGSFSQAWVTTEVTPFVNVIARNTSGGPGMWLAMNYSAGGTIGSAYVCCGGSGYTTANNIHIEAIGIGKWK